MNDTGNTGAPLPWNDYSWPWYTNDISAELLEALHHDGDHSLDEADWEILKANHPDWYHRWIFTSPDGRIEPIIQSLMPANFAYSQDVFGTNERGREIVSMGQISLTEEGQRNILGYTGGTIALYPNLKSGLATTMRDSLRERMMELVYLEEVEYYADRIYEIQSASEGEFDDDDLKNVEDQLARHVSDWDAGVQVRLDAQEAKKQRE